MIRCCVYGSYTELIHQRHRIVFAEALGTVILAVVKSQVFNYVLRVALQEGLLLL